MTTKRTLAMIGMVTVVAALAVVAWRRAERADRAASTASTSATASSALAPAAKSPARPPLTMEQLFAEGRAKISEPESKAGDETAAPPSPSGTPEAPPEPTALDRELEATLAADPVLRRFYNLRKKALRSKIEQAEYQALLADESLLQEAKAELAEGYSAEALDQSEELRRLQRIQYLNAALAWTDNPARGVALSSIESLLLAEIPAGLPKAVRGSLMGDKFDLYQHLMLADPERAKALLALASGTGSEKVLELAQRTGVSTN